MIIIINGSRNAGKTTTAILLSKKLASTVYIPIDTLREFIRCVDLEKSIPINLENSVLLAKSYTKRTYNVILDYCLRKVDHAYLIKNLKPLGVDIFTVTLLPSRSLALSQRGRALSSDDRKRIREQYNPLSKHFIPHLGLVITITPKMSSQGIVQQILSFLVDRKKNLTIYHK